MGRYLLDTALTLFDIDPTPREGTPMVPDASYPPRPAFRTIVVLGGIRTPSARHQEEEAYKEIAVDKPI